MQSKYRNYFVLIAYFVITALLYYSTKGAGMVFDFNGWLAKYEVGSYADVLNSFGYAGLHQMEQFAFFSLFKLFAYSHFGWYIVFAALHSIAAFTGFLFLKKLLEYYKIENGFSIALLSSTLFLISPYAADTVVNKVTVHYFLATIFIFSALYLEVEFFLFRKKKHFVAICILFVLGLFSLEITYVFPALFFVLWLALHSYEKELNWRKALEIYPFIPFALLFLFLLLHKFTIGSVVGHYGAEVHTKFDVVEIYSNLMRYLMSYLFFYDFYDYKYKEIISQFLAQYGILLIVFSSILALGVFAVFYKKARRETIVVFSALAMAVISLLPIINLYFVNLFAIENDRYSYLASLFFYFFIVYLIFKIKWKKFKLALMFLFFTLNIYFLMGNIQSFSKSSTLTWSLLQDFRWFEDEVIVLVDPQCFNGAKMFGTESDTSSFAQSLWLHTKQDRRANIHLVYQMNVANLNDSVVVEKIEKNEFKVSLAQWGNWFWKNNQGATSFENEYYKVEHYPEGKAFYTIVLKEKAQNYKLIYFAAGKWREVNK